MNIRTLDWIAESQENKTKQTEENNVLCHRLLCVPDSSTSQSIFTSNSIVIYNLENAFTLFILPESYKHSRERGQAEILSSWDQWGN